MRNSYIHLTSCTENDLTLIKQKLGTIDLTGLHGSNQSWRLHASAWGRRGWWRLDDVEEAQLSSYHRLQRENDSSPGKCLCGCSVTWDSSAGSSDSSSWQVSRGSIWRAALALVSFWDAPSLEQEQIHRCVKGSRAGQVSLLVLNPSSVLPEQYT